MKLSRRFIFHTAIGVISPLVILGALTTPVPDMTALLLFFALVIASQFTTVVDGKGTLSTASSVSFGAALIFMPFHAALVGVVSGIASSLLSIRRSKFGWRYGLFVVLASNAGMNALTTFSGALVFQSLNAGPLAAEPTLAVLLPLFVAALVDDQINTGILVPIISLQTGRPPVNIWRENYLWYMPINVVTMAIIGGALALGFNALGYLGLGIFFLPSLLSAYSFRAYITRTKSMMEHLEGMVQTRTAELEDANKSLHELHEQKDAFFAMITHDMRAPLTSMIGFADLLEAAGNIDKKAMPFLNAIKNNSQALATLVNDILELAKLDSEKMDFRQDPINLTQIVADVVLNAAGQALGKDIRVESDIHATPELLGDGDKLRRVFTNLMSNAVKYTNDGGSVFVDLCQVNGEVKFSVRDTGIGIPQDELPHIFERFRRVNNKTHRAKAIGTGLGLAIVKGFIQGHDGHIDVESQENVGSTFTVTIPVKSPETLLDS